MKFRKMVTMTLYGRQQKGHTYTEQTFGQAESKMLDHQRTPDPMKF